MDNFDYKKYLANNPLTEAYTPGSGWTEDFEYDDMMAHGLTLTADDSIEDLRKVAEDFTDVNYHREAAHLYDAIDAIEAGDRGEAKMYINKFRKEIKATLGGWDDVNEAQETMLTDDLVQRVAQAVADEFTSEDNELDLKYVITPNSIEADPRGGGFDLDVEAGPNTPGDDWEDSRGFSIDNYLGDYAGGSFVIRPEGDGYLVTNAASRNAKVAYITPEGEIEIISAEDSKADLGMTDDVETDYMERRKEMSDYMEEGEEEIKEIKSNKMKKSELKEIIKAAMLAEAEDVEVKDNEEVDVDIEKDVKIDDESVESDIEVDASMPGESGDEVAVQSLLMKAQEEAAKLGDEKLTDQIGNTITYFTRAHVATVDEGEEIDEIAALPGSTGVEDVNVDDPAEDAMVGLTESDRWKRIAGISKDNGLYSKLVDLTEEEEDITSSTEPEEKSNINVDSIGKALSLKSSNLKAIKNKEGVVGVLNAFANGLDPKFKESSTFKAAVKGWFTSL
jgi:hypothetical protein